MTPHYLPVLHVLLQRASCTRQTRACHAAGRNAGALVLPRVGASRPGSAGWKDLHSWPGPAPEARDCRLQRVPGRYATPPVAVRTTKLTTDPMGMVHTSVIPSGAAPRSHASALHAPSSGLPVGMVGGDGYLVHAGAATHIVCRYPGMLRHAATLRIHTPCIWQQLLRDLRPEPGPRRYCFDLQSRSSKTIRVCCESAHKSALPLLSVQQHAFKQHG